MAAQYLAHKWSRLNNACTGTRDAQFDRPDLGAAATRVPEVDHESLQMQLSQVK